MTDDDDRIYLSVEPYWTMSGRNGVLLTVDTDKWDLPLDAAWRFLRALGEAVRDAAEFDSPREGE